MNDLLVVNITGRAITIIDLSKKRDNGSSNQSCMKFQSWSMSRSTHILINSCAWP